MIETLLNLNPEFAKAFESKQAALSKAHSKLLDESFLDESKVKEIDSLSEEELKAKMHESIEEEIPQLLTRNEGLEGQLHPETGIPFTSRTVQTLEGLKTGVFPDFDGVKKFQTKLPESLYNQRPDVQNKFCDNQLEDSLKSGKLNKSNFTERQIEQIKNGDKPEGLVWHHKEDKGIMQLVPIEIHEKTGHTGGQSIWSGQE